MDNIPQDLEFLIARLQAGFPPGSQLSEQNTRDVIDGLPKIDENKLVELGEKDSSCPICLNSYLAIIAEEEMALVMDSPAHPVEWLGVTKLSQPWQCGHMFCRRDITKWVHEGGGTCPMCRRSLIDPASAQPLRAASDQPPPPPPPPPEPPASTETTAPETPETIPMRTGFSLDEVNLTGMNPDPDDPNQPSFEELRNIFLQNNPWMSALIFDGLTNGELALRRGRSAEEQPDDDRNDFSSMYS